MNKFPLTFPSVRCHYFIFSTNLTGVSPLPHTNLGRAGFLLDPYVQFHLSLSVLNLFWISTLLCLIHNFA